MVRLVIGGAAALLFCVFLSPRFIEFLRERSFGQHIRAEGPAGHHVKAGTPTMGGVVILIALSVPFLVLTAGDWRAVGAWLTCIACGFIGFSDDYVKLVKRRSLGLRGRTKLIGLMAASIGLWLIATKLAHLPPVLRLRFVDYQLDLGALGGVPYLVLIYLVVAGTTNAVNLTDGLDGLAAGCTAIVSLAFTAICAGIGGQQDLALLAATLAGACVGFLWFNAFPATVFMGDTGSLGIGGALAGLAVMTQTELLLVVLGGVFVIEALSVMIQVFSFQTFGRRVFLMAPIHHHFEMKAWSETKIILRFWIVASVFATVGFVLYEQSVAG
ncbi:MAG: phospho-N-acetylmuramoyl-pentapeptide-transferase [Solirubrobacteraceae bacterium]|nr:phospho-N-acetylmuramoyl-pentapeptide-transferase [Solirubrobacteraceae bacterium]